MSKSLDNYIGLTDEPHVMFAKLMKVPDNLLENYFTLLTDLPEDRIRELLAGHPVEAHKVLAREVTGFFAPQADLGAALERFQAVAKGGIPENVASFSVLQADAAPDGTYPLARLMVLAGLEPSLGAARRTIQGRGLKVDGQPFLDPQGALALPEGGVVIQKGKDKFARMLPEH